MKISLLIEREPFDKIFEETFTSFLNDFTNCPHKVKWYNKKNNNQSKESVQSWYCNPLINSIFVKGANPAVFNSISGEYSYNPLRPWRSLIQKLYLSLSQHKITAQLMAKYVIEVSPPIKDAKDKLIIGGNTKIRFIDIINRKVYVILKNGFNKKYLEKEVFVRTNFTYLPIPKINLCGNNGSWYCEDYVSGVSPDRIEVDKSHDVLGEAVQHIHKMLNSTKESEPLSEYVACLQERINKNIGQISHIDVDFKKEIINLTSTLATHLNKYSDHVITTAYCHGDFQEGNIIHDGEKTWILDWEYSGRKQIGYDLFVLLLKSRVYKGFSNRFLRLMNNELDYDQMELINNWPEIKWDDKLFKEISIFLFLLKELDFHIEENSNVSFFKASIGLTSFIREVMKIGKKSNLFVNANII